MCYFIINFSKSSSFFTYSTSGFNDQNSTWCSLCVECFIRISEQAAAFALYVTN